MSRYQNIRLADDETIDRWVTAWEEHAAELGRNPFSESFWDNAAEWIEVRRREL